MVQIQADVLAGAGGVAGGRAESATQQARGTEASGWGLRLIVSGIVALEAAWLAGVATLIYWGLL